MPMQSNNNAYSRVQPQNMQVYAPGFKSVLSIPAGEIRHLPPPQLNVTRLVLCANYDSRNPEGSCPMGARCKFVHADATSCPQHEIHVNYAWRNLDECLYERFPAGQVLHVAAPNSKLTGDVMDSQLALKTKALESTRRPLSHCAHYYFNRTCNLGPSCRFIHAIFIDPAAKEHQRAPAPTQLGREHHQHIYRQQRAAAAANNESGSRRQSSGDSLMDGVEIEQQQHLQQQQPTIEGGEQGWMGSGGRFMSQQQQQRQLSTAGTDSLSTTPRQSPAMQPTYTTSAPPPLNISPTSRGDNWQRADIQNALQSPSRSPAISPSRSPVAHALSMARKMQEEQHLQEMLGTHSG